MMMLVTISYNRHRAVPLRASSCGDKRVAAGTHRAQPRTEIAVAGWGRVNARCGRGGRLPLEFFRITRTWTILQIPRPCRTGDTLPVLCSRRVRYAEARNP
jgi:hypothetical protein